VRIAARTREEAEVKRAELVQQSQQAAPSVEDRDILLDEYFGRWLQQIATTVAPRTFESYSESYRRYVGPALGKMKVRAIHRGHIKALLTKKRAEGLSNNSVRLIRATSPYSSAMPPMTRCCRRTQRSGSVDEDGSSPTRLRSPIVRKPSGP
jgi:hypothetical protein